VVDLVKEEAFELLIVQGSGPLGVEEESQALVDLGGLHLGGLH